MALDPNSLVKADGQADVGMDFVSDFGMLAGSWRSPHGLVQLYHPRQFRAVVHECTDLLAKAIGMQVTRGINVSSIEFPFSAHVGGQGMLAIGPQLNATTLVLRDSSVKATFWSEDALGPWVTWGGRRCGVLR
eukprot:2547422-Amphidinium_carterae.1